MNLLIVSGNLVKDAVLRTTPSGKSVLSFTIANNEGHGEHERTTYYDCSMFGDRAVKLERHFTKGLKLVVNGTHSSDQSESNGKTYFNNRIFVHGFEFAGGKTDGGNQGSYSAAQNGTARPQPAQNESADFDDDMPF